MHSTIFRLDGYATRFWICMQIRTILRLDDNRINFRKARCILEMDFSRLCQTIRLWTIPGAVKRAQYLKDKNVFASFGEKCSYMDRRVPLYAKLIKVGNNVHFASHVTFLTHDVAHMMINRMHKGQSVASEKVGCIEIGNNVFVGSNTTILYDVKIGNNVVIGAGSLINKDVPDNSVMGGYQRGSLATLIAL